MTASPYSHELYAFLALPEGVDPVLLLRTNERDGSAYGGFRWPTEAEQGCTAPDWDPKPECGHGLHGALWGCGEAGHLYERWHGAWYVVAAHPDEVVDLAGKVKVPRAWVCHVGDRVSATQYLYERAPASATTIIGLSLTGGDGSTLTGGDRSALTGGDDSTLTGGDRSTLTGGNCSSLTGGAYSNLTGGYRSTLTGDYGSSLTWKIWDGERYRLHTFYVGEDGVEAGVAYRFENGEIVKSS